MKEKGKVRKLWVKFRVNEDEFEKINGHFKTSACRKLSEYARNILLARPVIIKYRNQSADEFLTEIIRLNKELNAIGHNYNQAVHKLHTLDEIPDIKAWAIVNETGKGLFLKKADEIKDIMNRIYKQWSQK